MSQSINNEIVYSKNVIEFLTVANEYCLFVEKAESYTKDDISQYLLKVLPLLYLKGTLLPIIKENDFEISERYVNEELWTNIYKSLNNKFGKDDRYKVIRNNDNLESVPSIASISDNLSDIYQDMKDFVILYQKGTHAAKENAVSECKKLFETHWGFKLLSAIKAIHCILFSENNPDEFFENDN